MKFVSVYVGVDLTRHTVDNYFALFFDFIKAGTNVQINIHINKIAKMTKVSPSWKIGRMVPTEIIKALYALNAKIAFLLPINNDAYHTENAGNMKSNHITAYPNINGIAPQSLELPSKRIIEIINMSPTGIGQRIREKNFLFI